MTIAGLLVRLYPRPFRDRWGPDLEADAHQVGWRSWPNLAAHLIDLWLHPTIWPADSPAQRRGRAAAMAIMVAVLGWFVARLSTGEGARMYTTMLRGCALLVLLGLALTTPRPRLTASAMTTVLRRVARHLAGPLLLGACVVITVHAKVLPHVSAVRLAVLTCWWSAWALAVIQSCRVLPGLTPVAVVPPPHVRLRLGIWALAAAAATAGTTVLVFSLAGEHPHPLTAALGTTLLILTVTFMTTLDDLRHQPIAD
jgi:hypothetical protein